jgi:YggT family protein
MSPVGQGGLFLLQFIAGIIVFVLLLRFFLRATYVDWRNPIVTFIAKITNPMCAPFSKVIPTKGRWDFAAIASALAIQAIYVILLGFLTDKSYGVALIAVFSITEILNQLLDLMFWLIIIQVILSWVSPGYNPNTAIFIQMAEPILAPFKRVIPPIGGMDLSPIVAILAIKLTQIIVVGSIAQLGQGLT